MIKYILKILWYFVIIIYLLWLKIIFILMTEIIEIEQITIINNLYF